ncbi:hypothetical protein AN189_12935 [Loktanella sp. 3ANDIMAR09]|uniref:hypothetical protein n=1 Tax=Loktanella sp. 3ANDIMAR09 TaxID=1225657 RepID=UPI0006FC75DD|nr:hypothetical protein [Loktanella sp. 3ANDIMAR09]KQI67978.1 hypothetical protein AN189_12935 [Loktanella sp. 3ANDIMAR09]
MNAVRPVIQHALKSAITILKADPPFAIGRKGGAYHVIDTRTDSVIHETESYSVAAARMGILAKEFRRSKTTRERPCMCCQTIIKSEGPHHRLCDVCRRKRPGLI